MTGSLLFLMRSRFLLQTGLTIAYCVKYDRLYYICRANNEIRAPSNEHNNNNVYDKYFVALHFLFHPVN